MKHSILLGLCNFRNYRKESRSFVMMFILSMVLLILTRTATKGFVLISNSYKTDEVSLREIQLWHEDKNGNSIEFDNISNRCIGEATSVERVSQFYNVILNKSYTIMLDEHELNCFAYIRGTNNEFSFLPMSTILDKNGGQYISPILCGKEFDKEEKYEAIIDENTCYLLGINDPEEVIGHSISICLSDMVISNIKIVGVCSGIYGYYDSELSKWDATSLKKYQKEPQMNPVFFSNGVLEDILKSCDVSDWFYESLVVLVDNTDHVKQICDMAKSVYNYSSDSMIATIESKAQNVNAVEAFLLCIFCIIAIISFIILFNILEIKIDNQKYFSEMAMKIGYKKKDIALSYTIEYSITVVKAAMISIILSLGISIIYDMFMMNVYSKVASVDRFVFFADERASICIMLVLILFVVVNTWWISILQLSKIERNMSSKKQ